MRFQIVWMQVIGNDGPNGAPVYQGHVKSLSTGEVIYCDNRYGSWQTAPDRSNVSRDLPFEVQAALQDQMLSMKKKTENELRERLEAAGWGQ